MTFFGDTPARRLEDEIAELTGRLTSVAQSIRLIRALLTEKKGDRAELQAKLRTKQRELRMLHDGIAAED